MIKKIFLISSSLFILAFPISSFSNCEAGANSIHTIATYELPDDIFIMKATPTEIIAQSGKIITGNYKVEGEKCNTISLSLVTNPNKKESNLTDESENEEVVAPKYILKGCQFGNMESFFKFNIKTHVVSLAKKIEIKEMKTSDILKTEIRKNLDSTILIPLVNVSGMASGNKKIAKEDIKNYSDFPIESSQAGKNLVMSIAKLDIVHLEKYFVDEGYRYYGEQYFNFEKRMAIFPVIFFTLNNNTYYVGDGAWCSEVTVIYRNVALTDRELSKNNPTYKPSNQTSMAGPDEYKKDKDGYFNLGTIHDYRLTGAFDFNNDDTPDILIINESIIYYLKGDGGLVVIDSPMGC